MLRQMKSWTTLDHTADLAIEGVADTAEGALEAVCEGLLANLCDVNKVSKNKTIQIKANGIDEADTIVSLLGELLYTVLVERFAVAGVRVVSLSKVAAQLECEGEILDPQRHAVKEVKAATFHDFSFAPDAGGLWRLRVVFDV
jgi:SHS2 domain-containing protein